MKNVNLKSLYILGLILIVSNLALAQTDDWKWEKGKALNQRTFALHEKTPSEVYKEISRWLVKYYRDPEDNLKARIEDEYLRGVAYHPNFLKRGALPACGLQYTFILTIKEQLVEFIITDVVIGNSAKDVDEVFRLDDYFNPSTKRTKDAGEEHMIKEVTNFSNELFESFQHAVFPPDTKI